MSGPKMINGMVANADTTLYSAPSDTEEYEADGAIPVGSAVALDVANLTGKLVVAATLMTGVVGIYEGLGGTGAVAGTGFSGQAAVDGDIITVTTRGHAVAIVAGDVVAVSDGEALAVEGAGVLEGGAAIADQQTGKIISLEATTAADAAVNVFVM